MLEDPILTLELTDHQIFDDLAPLINKTDDEGLVISVVVTWKIHWETELDRPSSVKTEAIVIAPD